MKDAKLISAPASAPAAPCGSACWALGCAVVCCASRGGAASVGGGGGGLSSTSSRASPVAENRRRSCTLKDGWRPLSSFSMALPIGSQPSNRGHRAQPLDTLFERRMGREQSRERGSLERVDDKQVRRVRRG